MGDNEYGELFRQAIEAGKNRDYGKAVSLLTHIVASTDRFPHALLYLGRSYHALGHFDKAVQILEFYLQNAPDSEPGHFFLGRVYLSLGNYKQAIRNLQFVAEINPEFSPCQGLLGLAYLRLRRPNTAVAYFERALKSDPDNPRIFTGYLNALLIKAIRKFHRKKHSEAEQIFRFILEHRPDSILAHLYLAKIYKEMERPDLALSHYEETSRLSPKDPIFPMLKAFILLDTGQSLKALQELDKTRGLIGELPEVKNPEILLRIITITLYRNKRYREAIFYARKILKQNYRDAEIHGIIAESYLNLKEYEKSRNHFMRSIETDRGRLEFHHGLALALWELKDYPGLQGEIMRIRRISSGDAIARYFEVLSSMETSDPSEHTIAVIQELIRGMGPDVHLMYALGKAYLKNNRPELSEGWFLRTLKLNENHRECYLNLIRVYQALGTPLKARQFYARYFDLFPDDRNRKSEYIRLLIEMQDFRAASNELASLLATDPHNQTLKKNLAYCHVKSENFNEAAILYKNLLKDNPGSIPLLRSLIACLDKTGKQETAILILRKAAEYFQSDPSVLLPLGVLYSRGKDFEKAKEVFRKVLSINPNDWRAYHNLAVLYRRTGQEAFASQFFKTAQKFRS